MIAAARSEALMGLVFVTESRDWAWVWVLPGLAWVWKGLGVTQPRLGQRGWYRLVGRSSPPVVQACSFRVWA